jgi:hypothetical protein
VERTTESNSGASLPDRELYWQRLHVRLRLSFIASAEEHARRTLGRGLSHAELRRLMARYRRDPAGR